MISSHAPDAGPDSRPSPILRGLASLVLVSFLASCANDPFHQLGLKQAKEGPVEEGVAKLKESSAKDPQNPSYRTDFLRERERAVNQALFDASRFLGKAELNEAESGYQRVLSLDPDNAQAKLGLLEVARSRLHADAMSAAQDAMVRADYEAARQALQPVLLEDPKNTVALDLSRQIEAARFNNGNLSQIPELGEAFKKPVSLQFRDANLKMIFEAISKTSGLNILMDKEVKNDLKATIFVKQASVEDTINLLLMQNQLEKKVLNESTLYIYPSTAAKLKEHQDLVVRTFQMTNADVKQMQTMLKTVLKTKDLFINEKTNSIVMRDTPEVVALAAKLLAAQDVNDPEVMLEVEVLEVSQSLLTEIGLAYPEQVSVSVDSSIKTLQQWKGLSSSNFNVTTNLGVTLSAKKHDGDVNILANPRIRVRQHEKAKIHIGERFPVITNTVTPSTGTPVVTGSIQYVDLGLKLEVEPDIHIDNEVGIKTSLEISKLGDEISNGTGDFKTSAYSFLTRTAVTTLRLKDGETQILGGLIDNADRKTMVKVPGLGDIPVLGRLFSSHKNDNSKMELVLAITPHIIRNIRQPEADLATYWSGTDNTIRTRPVTVEKMQAIKIESEGTVTPQVAPVDPSVQPKNPPRGVPNPPEVKPAVAPAPAVEGEAAKPVANPVAQPVPSATSTPVVPAVNPVTGLPTFGSPRPPAAPRGAAAGMSDAEVKPAN